MGYIVKVVINGSAFGQNINNILYYAQADGQSFPAYPSAEIADLADTLSADLVVDWCAALPDEYTLHNFALSTVDERGVTNSPYDVIETVEALGVQGGAGVGAMLCAIIPFQTLATASADLNLKRSYLAFGPLPETFVDDDQSITAAAATLIADILLILGTNRSGSVSDYAPVRVGRTVAPAPTRVGIVNGISLRPYASIRKSRMVNPRGT